LATFSKLEKFEQLLKLSHIELVGYRRKIPFGTVQTQMPSLTRKIFSKWFRAISCWRD